MLAGVYRLVYRLQAAGVARPGEGAAVAILLHVCVHTRTHSHSPGLLSTLARASLGPWMTQRGEKTATARLPELPQWHGLHD